MNNQIDIREEKLSDRTRYYAESEGEDIGYLVIQSNLNSKAEQITAFRIYDKKNRNRGVGTLLMAELIKDYKGKTILVMPMPYDETENISVKDLKNIYFKFGFKQHPKYDFVMFLNN